jgi:uncharacterized protein YjdB
MAVLPLPHPDPFPRASTSGRVLRTLLAGAALCLLALVIWSCNTDPQDENILTLRLDSARVGKFDSVLVEIYNGKAPGPGDTARPVQSRTIEVTPATKEISLKLDAKVKPDFTVVVTGYAGDQIAYRNLHTVDGFTTPDSTKPSVLLISRILAEDLTLNVGETRLPTLSFEPSDPADKRILLKALDSDLVAVVADSLKGLAQGDARVQASTPDGKVKVTFTAHVTAVRVTALRSDTLLLKVGESLPPEVEVVPGNATDKEYSLESLNPELFEVDGKAVTGLKPGQGKLVLASHDGGVKDTIIVRVRVPVTGISGKDQTHEVGDRFSPVLEFQPEDATRRGYTLTTSDSTKVAVAGDKDSLEAKAVGSATITVKTNDGGFTAEFTVEVVRKVFHVQEVSAEGLRGLVGDTLAPELIWTPSNATEQGFTLASDDTTVASVIGERIIARKIGKAGLTLTTVDGGKQADFAVSVENSNFNQDIKPITSSKCAPCHAPPTSFNFDWTDSAQLVRKGTIAIKRLNIPEGQPGHMPLKGADGGPITNRELKVLLAWLARTAIPLQSATVSDTTVNLGDTLAPPLKAVPANASNQLYKLGSSDTLTVAIRGDKLLPVAVGKATIDVNLDETAQTAKFTLTVIPPAYERNVRPIVAIKCAPCHFGPTAIYNWQDSSALISDGTEAIRRLTLPIGAKGHMPFSADSSGPPNGELSAQQLRVLLAWLHAKVVPLVGITVPNDSIMLGQSKPPPIVFNPPNASNKTYSLESSDSSIVDIDQGKLVGAAVGGPVSIHVTALDGGFGKFFTVKVIPVPADSIIAHDSAGAIGDTVIPMVDFFPANATNKAFTLALINPSTKIQIAPGNKIVGIGLGKDSVLAASAVDPSKKSKLYFTVGPVLAKSLSATDTNGVVGGALIKPRLTWIPATTTDKRFLLTVTAGDTATIAAARDSLMLPKTAAGKVTVTARALADTSIKDSFTFTVGTVAVQSISLSNPSVQLAIGSSLAPKVVFNPTNATNKGFSISIPAAASANIGLAAGGLSVTGIHLTSASLTITSTDGAKTAPWAVTVIRPPMGAANKTLIQNRCGGCHFTANASGIPAWWNTAGAVDSALIVSGTNPNNIINRVSVLKDMPPTAPALTATEISTLVSWLNTK